MPERSPIIIGCDDASTLSLILNKMEGKATNNVIVAMRNSELLDLIKKINPSLVILSFRNNQITLNNICGFLQKLSIPILCLTSRFENEALHWDERFMIFTQPMEYCLKNRRLTSWIRSIYQLQSHFSRRSHTKSLTEQAQQTEAASAKDLSRYALELDQKVGALIKIKNRIIELYPKVNDPIRMDLMAIVNSIKVSTTDKRYWEAFKVYFENINPRFLEQLSKKHPSLTQTDLKYCCYLTMNLSNDDIRHLLGINPESVRTHKYRLKKKLTLSKNQDLCTYIKSLLAAG